MTEIPVETTGPKKPTLDQLHEFRDRIKIERLGQEDPQYRDELAFVIDRTDLKIEMVKRGIYIDPPWSMEVLRGNFVQGKV